MAYYIPILQFLCTFELLYFVSGSRPGIIPGVHERTQSIKCYSRSKALRSFVDTRYETSVITDLVGVRIQYISCIVYSANSAFFVKAYHDERPEARPLFFAS